MKKQSTTHKLAEKSIEKIVSKEGFLFQWEKSIEQWIANWAQEIYISNKLEEWFSTNETDFTNKELFKQIILKTREFNSHAAYISLGGKLEKAIGDSFVDIDGKFFVFEAKQKLGCEEWRREALNAKTETNSQKQDEQKQEEQKQERKKEEIETEDKEVEGGKGRLKLLDDIQDEEFFKLHDECHFLVGSNFSSDDIEVTNYWNFIKKGRDIYNSKGSKKIVSFEYDCISLDELRGKGCSGEELTFYVEGLLRIESEWSGVIVGILKNSTMIVNVNNAIKPQSEPKNEAKASNIKRIKVG